MKVAIAFHRGASVFSRESVGPTRHSQRKAQRLLSKKRPEARPENSSVDGKRQKPDSSSFNEAVRLAQRGDAAAFEIIYQQHSGRVHALCLRMLRDPVEAEDRVQEVFIHLLRKIHTYRGESAFSTWLHRLTANLVLMHLRRKKPISISLDEIDGSDEGDDRPRNEIGAPDPRLSGLVDRITLQSAIERCRAGTGKFLLSTTFRVTTTGKLPGFSDARSEIQSLNYTRPVSACANCFRSTERPRETRSRNRGPVSRACLQLIPLRRSPRNKNLDQS